MVTLQYRSIAAALLIAASAAARSQSTSAPQPAAGPAAGYVASPPPPTAAGNTSAPYIFPNSHQQFRNYLYSTFGPPGFISSAVGAGLDQRKPAPPEWDSGAQGYFERYGWRFGMQLVSQTTAYSLGALSHEDVAYHRCACAGLFPRTTHAFVSTLTAKTSGGRTVFSVPALVSPYAGSFAAVNAWYPARYEPADALRIGSMSFVFKAAGNLVGEFLAPAR
jgi:hypothetical protein